MRINEIIYTNQGEGNYAGVPSLFIRTQGCNLFPNCCKWCDTSFSQNPLDKGRNLSVEDIYEEASKLVPYLNSWVCITGGEPLMQEPELNQLAWMFKENGYKIEIETNGTLPKPSWWTKIDSWVADIKCPSSGVSELCRIEDWFSTGFCDQVKLVVSNSEDLAYASDLIDRHSSRDPSILVSPALPKEFLTFEEGNEFLLNYIVIKETQKWIREVWQFCLDKRVRFSLQLHKVAWGSKRGV